MVHFAIHGAPRSGTTWLGELVNSSPSVTYHYQPLFSHALKGFLSPESLREEVLDFFGRLESHDDAFTGQTEARAAGKLPRFEKAEPTHVGYKEVRYHHILPNLLEVHPAVKVVLLTRNPLAVISSWLSAPREFRKDLGWDELEEWRHAPKKNLDRPEEFNGYERWKDATLLFHRLADTRPESVHLVNYGDLVEDTPAAIAACFRFLGLEVTAQTRDFIAGRFQGVDDPYSVFRDAPVMDRWRDRLPAAVIEGICEDLSGTALEPYLSRP